MGVVNKKALQPHNGRSKAFHSYVLIVCETYFTIIRE